MDSFVLCEFRRWFFFLGGFPSIIIPPIIGVIFSSFDKLQRNCIARILRDLSTY